MFSVGTDEYTVTGTVGELPVIYTAMVEHASFHDDLGIKGADGTLLVVAVERAAANWPHVLVSLRFEPGVESGFHPGAILIAENHLLLLGAGTRLLAYDLRVPSRLWEDVADVGFWRWKRHGDVVVMSAELELAAWDLRGKKLWSTFVEPPWHYSVRAGYVELDVMGKKLRFAARNGPGA
jgi:hypothetical protein